MIVRNGLFAGVSSNFILQNIIVTLRLIMKSLHTDQLVLTSLI